MLSVLRFLVLFPGRSPSLFPGLFLILIQVQSVEPAHGFYQAACIDDFQQIIRKIGNGILFSILENFLPGNDGNLIALPDIISQSFILNQKETVVDGIAEEDAGE